MGNKHRAEQLIDAIIDNIGTTTAAGEHVYSWAARSLPNEPYLIEIQSGADDIESIAINTIDSWLTVFVDLHTNGQQPVPRERGALPAYKENLFLLRKDVHIEIMRDITQGLGFVIDTKPAGALEPQLNGDGESVAAFMRTVWQIKYRSSINDPSQ